MTVAASDAEPGRLYRPTRSDTTAYYKICDASSVRRLEARLRKQNVRLMKPEDRFAWQAVLLVRSSGYILAARFIRFRDDSGGGHETRAYVAFPPGYPLREIKRPPSYGGKRTKGHEDDEAESDALGPPGS